jgi:hypothetical protein
MREESQKCLPDPDTEKKDCLVACEGSETCCNGACAESCDECASDEDCDTSKCQRCGLDATTGRTVCLSTCEHSDPCFEDFECESTTGKCIEIALPKPDGTSCDDGDSCTSADACANGRCIGTRMGCCNNEPCCANAPLAAGNQCCADGTQGPRCCGSTALGADQTCCGDPSAPSTWPLRACSAGEACLICQPQDPINYCVAPDEKCCYFSHIPAKAECCALDNVAGATISCPEGSTCLRCPPDSNRASDFHCAPPGYKCCSSVPIPGDGECCGLDATGTSVSWCPGGTHCIAGGRCR